MTIKTLKPLIKCANPACPNRFHVGEGYSYTNCCSKECAQAITPPPRMTGQRVTPNVSQTIIAPHVNRRAPGGTNRRQTE